MRVGPGGGGRGAGCRAGELELVGRGFLDLPIQRVIFVGPHSIMALAFAPSAVRLPEDLLYAIIGKASSLGELHQWALVHSTLLPVVGPALYKHVIIDSAGYLIPFLERLVSAAHLVCLTCWCS